MTKDTAKPQPETDINLERLVNYLLTAKVAIQQWKDRENAIKDKLTLLHKDGKIASEFTCLGKRLALRDGHTSVKLDKHGNAMVADLKDQLVKSGHGETVTGDSYWHVSTPAKAKA